MKEKGQFFSFLFALVIVYLIFFSPFLNNFSLFSKLSESLAAPLLIILGLIPSLVWLFYYLRKDCHPEPKSLIARTFFLGILVAPLAIIAELWFVKFFKSSFDFNVMDTVLFFIWAAFAEEYVKYLAVRFGVINNPNFDEPVDAMIYMVSAGLGFAAIENILVIIQAYNTETIGGIQAAFQIWGLRFAGATLLHAVSSALLGYFLALSWFYSRHSKKIMVIGFMLATFAHFVFNYVILTEVILFPEYKDQIYPLFNSLGTFLAISLLVSLVLMISFLFRKIRARMAKQVNNISSAQVLPN